MAQPATQPTTGTNGPTPGEAPKAKRKRAPSVAKPAFFVIEILGDDGQPIPFDKKRVKLISVERDAEKVMEMTDAGNHPNAFYLRGLVPAGRGGVKPA